MALWFQSQKGTSCFSFSGRKNTENGSLSAKGRTRESCFNKDLSDPAYRQCAESKKRQFAVKNGERVDPAVHGPDVIYQIADAPLGPTALSLPKPAYPPAARARNLQGRAIVDVVIDEDGKVRLAGYISGELLLLSSSRDSACKAKFNRQIIDGKAVKVIGVVEYTFIAPR